MILSEEKKSKVAETKKSFKKSLKKIWAFFSFEQEVVSKSCRPIFQNDEMGSIPGILFRVKVLIVFDMANNKKGFWSFRTTSSKQVHS